MANPRTGRSSGTGLVFIRANDGSNTITILENEATAVGMEEDATEFPHDAQLTHNYPNPFGQKTTIAYRLVRADAVTLRVYDALGRNVVTLVDSFLEAGDHEAEFDAGELPSGVYRVWLRVGTRVYSRVMIRV